jgi:hypothetical protein
MVHISRKAEFPRFTFFLFTIFGLISIWISPVNASGPILPNSAVTPGAIDPSVTQANIARTICILGYTTKIRPPASYTTKLKMKQLASFPYSAYGSKDSALFEEDHLISLELGGNPTDPKNLWPEPYSGAFGARAKDQLENKFHALICAHQIQLADAQSLIASNWYDAYKKYVLGINPQPISITSPSAISSSTSLVPATSQTPAQPLQSSPVSSPTPSRSTLDHPANAKGKCKDGTFSYSATHSGMCSGHGGVAQFYP